jgi:hypothetical protein
MADMLEDADQLPHFLVAACPRPAAELDYAERLAAHADGLLLHVEDARGGVLCVPPALYDVIIHRPTPDQARWIADLLRRRAGSAQEGELHHDRTEGHPRPPGRA